jgi:hypothetical protein
VRKRSAQQPLSVALSPKINAPSYSFGWYRHISQRQNGTIIDRIIRVIKKRPSCWKLCLTCFVFYKDESGHTEEDTLKQISNTSHCLKMDLALYKRASFDTFLKRQVFGIQFMGDKMTLTSSRLISPTRYAFIEVRSAVIPTDYAHRCSWVKVFELLLKLKVN